MKDKMDVDLPVLQIKRTRDKGIETAIKKRSPVRKRKT